jgi:hypothetical protein
VVRLDVLEAGAQWRHFAPGALQMGVRSVLSVPVVIDETVGALNLYSRSAGAFDDTSEQTGKILAAYAADVISSSWLYVSSVELVEDVLAALSAHETINVAVGIVMSREGCGEIEAARRLTERGEGRGQTLLETAEWELREQQLRTDVQSDDAAPRGPDAEAGTSDAGSEPGPLP